MDAAAFVADLHRVVYLAAVDGTEYLMADPPGRRPGAELVELHAWWAGLAEADRAMVRRVSRMSADLAVFGFLCVLDNVRTIGAGEELVLKVVGEDGVERALPEAPDVELHDLFRSLVDDADD